MSRLRLPVLGLLLALLGPLPARADVILLGSQHIGDDPSTGALPFMPRDPVRRDQHTDNPSYFHLSQQTTIREIRFDQSLGFADPLEAVFIDGLPVANDIITITPPDVFKLLTPLVLDAGIHRIGVRPRCLTIDLLGRCAEEDDVGFTQIRLVSDQTTTSRALSQRRSIGDDNDGNDDYDIEGTATSRWYPDLHEGAAIDIPFSIDADRILSAVNFYRLRDVNATDAIRARVLVNGQLIGEITGNGEPGPFRLLTRLALAQGTHTLRIESGVTLPGDRDTISWDDIILFFGNAPGGTPGAFNAVDENADAVGGRLKTKIAGVNMLVDIVALNAARDAANVTYTGTLKLELLNADNNSGALDANGCRSSWVPAVPTLSEDVILSNAGRAGLSTSYPEVLRQARWRITDTTIGTVSCSVDAFSIRPDRFDLLASDDTATTPGTSRQLNDTGTGGNRTHRAGQPFTLRVIARNAAGAPTGLYDGSPTVEVSSVVQGPLAGTLTTSNWIGDGSGVRRTNAARYTEAGTFNLRARDDNWADVDIIDTEASSRSVISPATGTGRFTPDRFRLLSRVDPILQPACGSFGYLGQPMNYATAPSLILEAINAAGGRVRNYGNSQLFKLPGALPLANYQYRGADAAGASLALGTVLPSPDNGIANLGDGTARLSFSASPQLSILRTTPVAPFTPKLALEVLALSDSDGVAVDSPSSLNFGSTAVAGAGIAFAGGAAEQRFGRLVLEPGYGPELQALRMDYGSEYFLSATAGFVRSLGDSCTLAPTIALDPTGYTTAAIVPGFVAGRGEVELAAPGTSGRVTVQLTPAGWLLTDLDGDGYDDPATAVATFGTFRGGDRRIYQRETYR